MSHTGNREQEKNCQIQLFRLLGKENFGKWPANKTDILN